jgi:hypothetical protein
MARTYALSASDEVGLVNLTKSQQIARDRLPTFLTVDVYKHDVCVSGFPSPYLEPPTKKAGQKVTEFSYRSRKKMAFVAKNSGVEWLSMVTITYPKEYSSDGKKVKRDLNRILTAMRQKFAGIKYLWFLEFQRRGAPHFHILTDYQVPEPLHEWKRKGRHSRNYVGNIDLHNWLSRRWYKIAGHGDEKHLKAGSSWEVLIDADAGAKYAAKYAGKMEQKSVPEEYQDVGRFWATGYGVKAEPMKSVRMDRDEFMRHFAVEIEENSGKLFTTWFDKSQSLLSS